MFKADVTLEELSSNPEKFGIPSLAEILRPQYNKRDQFFGREDDEIAAIDRGDPALGCLQRYYIQDTGPEYRVDSLDELHRISVDMGLNLFHDFTIDPQLTKDSSLARGYFNKVTFRSKRSIDKRTNWT